MSPDTDFLFSIRFIGLIALLAHLNASPAMSQKSNTEPENLVELNNGCLLREIQFQEGCISSTSLRMAGQERNYIHASEEFSFRVNEQVVNGSSGWILEGTEAIRDKRSGSGTRISLAGTNDLEGLLVEINYLLYPDMPLVRKWLRIENRSHRDMMIEALNVEDLQTDFSQVSTVVHHNYARMKQLGSFIGSWDDPVVVAHRSDIQRGRGVVEALRSGVQMNTLAHFMNVDDLAVLRHRQLDREARRQVILQALRQVGKSYDFNFDTQSADRIVCSELVYHAYGDVKWPTERKLGRVVVSPDNIAQEATGTGPFNVVLLYHDGAEVTQSAQTQLATLIEPKVVTLAHSEIGAFAP